MRAMTLSLPRTERRLGHSAKEHQTIDLILLDRMMPVLDGIEFLKRYRAATNLKRIPVIMQTAASEPDRFAKGWNSGCSITWTKPYDEEVLISLVKAAIEDSRRSRDLYAAMEERDGPLRWYRRCDWNSRPLPRRARLPQRLPTFSRSGSGGQWDFELLINAVEHGNLGIQYAEKTALLHAGRWLSEVELRQASPDYNHKQVSVHMQRHADHMILQIDDEGDGFDWKKYMEFNAERASDPHGRGIAMANMLSFDKFAYQGKGNSVICTVNLPAAS